MTTDNDLTRWNRSGLSRFRYVDGNAPAFLESLRSGLARRFGGNDGELWQILHMVPETEELRERLRRVESQYGAERRDMGWEILRLFARSCHILAGHLDAYANEGFLGTATQWDNVRRLVEMLDYHPAPPASAFTSLALVAKPGAKGVVAKGLQMKYSPASGPAATFETLEDVVVDDALNELRPAGYGRNPSPLTGAILTFEGAIKHLKTGEPVVVEDEHTGTLRGYVVQGVLERANRTELTVRPPLWRGFLAGHTIVHAQPVDRLDPRGPAAAQRSLGGVLYLVDPPEDLHPGEIVCIRDVTQEHYRRVVAVRGRMLVFDPELPSLDSLDLAHATVARAQLVSVNRLPGRTLKNGVEIRIIRLAGDYSRLAGRTIADLCIAQERRTTLAEYVVSRARFIPGEQKDENAGYTLLEVSVTDQACKLGNPQSIWVPPVGGGWAVDRVLERPGGRLRVTVRTSKPKKAAGGDLAAIVRGNQIAWARLNSVAIDAPANEATLTSETGWNDRGGADFYLADTWVYAHFKQQLRVRDWQVNDTLVSHPMPLDAIPDVLRKGTKVLLESAGSEPVLATVLLAEDGFVTFSRALPEDCTVDSLILRGNIVSAGHGESKSERVLGSGSASQSNQVFLLQVNDVSFIADSTQATGVRADIAVRVGGAEWKQVSTLNDSGPADPHYVVRMTEDGFILIGFGDGTNGRRLPTGANNVRIAFREGNGPAGNIPAGGLTKPAKPHALVAAVRQLTPAIGGNAMESTASLRENAPASLLTLERAVSLSDFGYLAGSHSSVWQARAFARPNGFGQREKIEVVVVPANGTPLGELASTLREFLLQHGVPGVAIEVREYDKASFNVDVELTVDQEMFVADEVREAVKEALRHAFALAQRRLGQDVFLSEVYKVVENVTGVAHSTVTVNEDRNLRRLMTPDDTVQVLHTCTVRVLELAPTVPPAGAESPPPPGPLPGPARPIGARGSVVIDGIGTVYAQRLAAAGVRTVRALAAVDPDTLTLDMPRPKLWEAVVKAQLLLESRVDVVVADAVLDRSLAAVAEMTNTALATITRASAERVAELLAMVRRLQVALDETAFTKLTLREFIAR